MIRAFPQPPQPVCNLASSGPPFWGSWLSLMPHSNLLGFDPVQPNPSPRPHLLSSSPPPSSLLPGSLPSAAHLPLVLPLLPSPVPSPALGPQTSWASSPASHDAAGAQPLGSGTSGCCLQVERGLLRAPLALATHLLRALQGQNRRKREIKKGRDTQLSFLGAVSLPIREGGGVEKTLVPHVSESRDSR